MFRKKPTKVETTIADADYELSTNDAEYRNRRMLELVGFYDSWRIGVVNYSTSSGSETVYIPYPLWDDEWKFARKTFPTRGEALAEVERVGGRIVGS